MKFTLSTCALFMILPWKLMCETTFMQTSTWQNEEATIKADNLTNDFLKDTKEPLNPTDETTFSNSIITDHDATIKAEEPTTFSAKQPENLKRNKTTNDPSNIWLTKRTLKDNKTIIMANKYTTMENKNNLSETLPQTSGQQNALLWFSSHPTYSNFSTELTQKETIKPQSQNMSNKVITTGDYQTLYDNFKTTKKVPDRSTHGNRTTRSADKASTSETNIPTNWHITPEIITTSPRVKVHTTELLTTEGSLPSQQKETMQPPILNTTDSNGTLDIATHPLNASTTVFSNGLGLMFYINSDASKTTDTMDITTHETTTEESSSEIKYSKPSIKSTPTTRTDNFPVKDKNKSHPGAVIASVIGSTFFLMFVAFVVVLIRDRQMRKKKMENPNWAGPSPFIESDNQTHPSTINEEGQFYRRESRKISLYSFLPQGLSKRLSMLSQMDEEVPFEDVQTSRTFGHEKDQPPNGKPTTDQFQEHEANGSPEVSPEANLHENLSIPSTPGKEETQPEAKSEDEIIPSPPEETNSLSSIPFEDVDLNVSLNKNAESIPPLDSLPCPTPPPLPQS